MMIDHLPYLARITKAWLHRMCSVRGGRNELHREGNFEVGEFFNGSTYTYARTFMTGEL